MIGHRVAAAIAGALSQQRDADRLRADVEAKRQARHVDRLMHKAQPPLPPAAKHRPRNTHCPGSVAYSVLGARIVR